MIDDSKNYPEWVRKIEEDVGHSIAFMATGFDESVRDELVSHSEIFYRFVRFNDNNFFRTQKNKSSSND